MENESNLQIFLKIYKQELGLAVKESPEDYAWPLCELDIVFGRMRAAILKGSFNKESRAFKQTCKKLKIKHTYKDINNFISKGLNNGQ